MAGSIAKAYVQVIPSAKGIKGKLSGMLGGEAGSAGTSAGKAFGSNLISKVKGLIAAAGIGKLLGESLQAGGALQQSLGGIETLFKDSADAVIKNAEQAYKTAGMSANQYMETVTSFSASLLQGLGGDTAKAASVADMAMTDMSDNANKMGTSMESIQNAYQGFAKQNYTMLDNLKLGYGGTKTEMERLLKDAEEISGVKYDISNLSDVYSAIHVIQGELGITGTTAKESAETFSGSMASMKAAFSNVLADLSLGRDIGPSLSALGETVATFVQGNLLPMLGNILSALPDVIRSMVDMIIQGMNMTADNAEAIAKTGVDFVTAITSAIVSALPQLAEAAINVVQSLVDGIGQNQDRLVSAAVISITFLANSLISMLPQIVELGLDLIISLANGIAESLPALIPTIVEVVLQIVDALTNPETLSNLLDAAIAIITELAWGLIDAIPRLIDAVFILIDNIVDFLIDPENIMKLINVAVELVIAIGVGLVKAIPQLLVAVVSLITSIVGMFVETDWGKIGSDLVAGFKNGISRAWTSLKTWFKNLFGDLIGIAKKILGIASPSKVMRDQIGKWIPSGVAVGIEGNTKPLTDALHDLSDLTTDTLQTDLRVSRAVGFPATAVVSSAGTTTGGTEGLLVRIVDILSDIDEGTAARQNDQTSILGEILQELLGIEISDDVLGRAVDRYNRKKLVMSGGI